MESRWRDARNPDTIGSSFGHLLGRYSFALIHKLIFSSIFRSVARKSFDDAALDHRPTAAAGRADAAQLGRKTLEVGQLALDGLKVPLCNPAYFRTGRRIFGREPEQVADLIEREA
jgi:hypothetical protein